MTVEEYLAFEETAEERHEFLDGQIFAMSGGTAAHDRLAGNAYAELRAALRGKTCEAHGQSLRVKVSNTGLYTYPDALVVCGPQFEDAKKTTLLNPRVIVEVLSPSTERYNRGRKFAHFRALESLAHYVLVSTSDKEVEVFTRRESDWNLHIEREGAIVLPAIDVSISIEALYERVELEPESPPPIDRA